MGLGGVEEEGLRQGASRSRERGGCTQVVMYERRINKRKISKL